MNRVFVWFDKNLRGPKLIAFLAPAVIGVIYLLFFNSVILDIERQKLDEKLYDIDRAVSIIARDIEYEALNKNHDDWEINRGYLDAKVKEGIEDLDMTYGVYARLFKSADLIPISEYHQVFAEPFDPLAYPDFVSNVATHYGKNENFGHELWFTGAGDGGHEIHLRCRWVPVSSAVDDPYLIVIGVGKYAVRTQSETWLKVGLSIFGIYVTALSFVIIGYILHIIDRRKEAAE